MTEPNKHRRTETPGARIKPPEAPEPGRLSAEQASQLREALSGTGSRKRETTSVLPSVIAWFRTTPGLVVGAVLVLGLAFLVRTLATGDDPEKKAGPAIPGAVTATYGDRWTAVGGATYEISIETLSDLAQAGSDGGSGCLATPPAGTANLRFRIILTNKSDREVEVPRVDFGTDLGRNGALVTPMPSFAKSNKRVVVTPLAPGASSCKDVARLGAGQRPTIPAGGAVEFFGTFGPIKVPVSARPTVIFRYYADDNGKAQPHDLLAPFGSLAGS